MSSDVLGNFGCLDELIQVIYQSVDRFVVLSNVSDKWTIHLGLAGPEGRWWRGNWDKSDILQIVGSKSSDKLLEAFAEKLADTFIQGELYITDWSAEEGAKIKLTLGPSSKKPLHIPLLELSSAHAAAHATNVFVDIALQAQSRKGRLHPSQYPTTLASLPPSTSPDSARTSLKFRPIAPKPAHSVTVRQENAEASSSITSEEKAQEEIKALKAQLSKEKKRLTSPTEQDAKAASSAPRALKGASLANPNKKARKYQAIEFESDEE